MASEHEPAAGEAAIVHVNSVREFFEEAVSAALAHHDLTPEQATTAYLVELLCEQISRPPELDESLSAMVIERRSAVARWRRIQRLKRAGDHALYVAGYFGPSLGRRVLDLDYYNTIGFTAYRRLGDMLGRDGDTQLSDVYNELAGDFPEFVDLLNEVRAQTGCEEADALALYEEWLRSGSGRLRARLSAAGFVISSAASKNN